MENNILMKSGINKNERKALTSNHLPVEVEEWEFEVAGQFLLNSYRKQFISRKENWFVSKGLMNRELDVFLNAPENKEIHERLKKKLGTFNVGTLLDRSKFLINTKRGSGQYRINYERLFGMEMLDLIEKKYLFQLQLDNNANNIKFENKDNNWQFLEYAGTDMQFTDKTQKIDNKWQCTICQKYFNSLLEKRYHIQEHHVDNQGFWSKSMIKFDESIVKVSAQLDNDMKKVNFRIACSLSNKETVFVEKVILVVPYNFYTILTSSGNLKSDNCFFSVDVGLLNGCTKHTFVFIIRHETKKTMRMVEQHNYMHTRLKNIINLNSIGKSVLNNKKYFIIKERLQQYALKEQWIDPFKKSLSIEDLKKLSLEFADYMNTNKKMSLQNINGTLTFLLQMEDLHRCFVGKIVEKQVTLKKIGENYIFKRTTPQNIFVENLLNHQNQVYLRYVSGKSTDADIDLCLSNMNKSDEEFVNFLKTSNSKVYLGNVSDVNNGYIVFSSPHNIPLNQKYLIIIRPSRYDIRLQYRALEKLINFSALDMSRFFFPQFTLATFKVMPRTCLILHNGNIYKDHEQLQAVQNICDGPYRDDTYIVEGPAGSGKTSVLIESIMQLYEKNKKILVLANTENACDILAIPLSKLLKQNNKISDMARIYSHLHELENVHELSEEEITLRETSNICIKHFYPTVAELHNKHIVVTTVSVAGHLTLGNFGRDSNSRAVFDYIFVDNATTLTEPELLTALVNVLSPTASLILAGDRHQMGPMVYSARVSELGLGVSLMERLLQYDCYQINKNLNIQSNSVYTRLQNNYRSNASLVDMCSEMFHYKVKSMANIAETTTTYNWHKLMNPYTTCLIHNIPINNMQGLDWRFEALDLILIYLKELKYFGIDDKIIKDKDIGVMVNYDWEARFLRNELRMHHWNGVQIDTFSNFCGQEKQIIFCLMTLNNANLEAICNPKNLNSIITRAKSLIVFFGNVPSMKSVDGLANIIAACNKRRSIFVSNKDVELENSFDKLLLNEPSNKGAIPKNHGEVKKPNQLRNSANLSHSMKRAHNNKNPQKLGIMMHSTNRNQQKGPIENMFQNWNKDTVLKKESNERIPVKNPQIQQTKDATNLNKILEAKKTVSENDKILTKPSTYLKLQETTNVHPLLQQTAVGNENNPIQVNFQFPNITSMSNLPVQQQLYPLIPEPPPQYQPPSYESARYGLPQKEKYIFPTAPPLPCEQETTFKQTNQQFRKNSELKKTDKQCTIA